jgi:DNA-binding NarL/FixJ family response regulator
MTGQGLRILLADDQVLFAETLCTLLNNYAGDLEVIGIAENGEKAISMTREHKPDIILMDVRMPLMDGVEAVKRIKEEFPNIKIIMLSTYQEDDMVRSSLMAGASGYLLKDISPTELITAIRALNSVVMQISPEIVKQLIMKRYNPSEEKTEDGAYTFSGSGQFEWFHTLTKREREFFVLIATGYDNEEIAEKLNLSLQTVMNMVSTIYSKLGVKDRFEIIRLVNSQKKA